MNESALTKRICDQMKLVGALVQPIVGGMRGQSGWPDRFIIHRLFFGFIEFKREENRVSKIQQYLLDEINRRCPYRAFVCRFRAKAGEDFGWHIDIEYAGKVICCNHAFDGEELLQTLGNFRG